MITYHRDEQNHEYGLYRGWLFRPPPEGSDSLWFAIGPERQLRAGESEQALIESVDKAVDGRIAPADLARDHGEPTQADPATDAPPRP